MRVLVRLGLALFLFNLFLFPPLSYLELAAKCLEVFRF